MNAHNEGRAEMADVLSFIEGFSTWPSEKWRARFPEWSELTDKARARFRIETEHGRRGWAKSSASVDSENAAIHHWVFLPLIRQCLEREMAT